MNNRRKFYIVYRNILMPIFIFKAIVKIILNSYKPSDIKDLIEFEFQLFLSRSICKNEELERIKPSMTETAYILGCGTSIKKIPKEKWNKIQNNFSIGLNYFYCHEFVPSIQMIEFGKSKKAVECLNSYISKCDETILIHARHQFFSKKNISIKFKENTFLYSPIVLRSRNKKFIKRFLNENLTEEIIHHCSNLDCAISFAVKKGFKNISLVGIDLNDSKYFWDDRDELNSLQTDIAKAIEDDYNIDCIDRSQSHATTNDYYMKRNVSLTIDEYIVYLNQVLSKKGISLTVANDRSRLIGSLEYKEI